MKKQAGVITVDLIFALTLALGFMAILFSICMTLSVAEVTQYIVFASSRCYFAGHVSESAQQELAKAKYSELLNDTVLGIFFHNNWFEVDKEPPYSTRGNFSFDDEYKNQYANGQYINEGTTFTGIRIKFVAKMLAMTIPFLGKTYDDEDGFVTYIDSFLMREPTMQECQEFNSSRFKAIKTLDGRFASGKIKDDAYVVMADNGC